MPWRREAEAPITPARQRDQFQATFLDPPLFRAYSICCSFKCRHHVEDLREGCCVHRGRSRTQLQAAPAASRKPLAYTSTNHFEAYIAGQKIVESAAAVKHVTAGVAGDMLLEAVANGRCVAGVLHQQRSSGLCAELLTESHCVNSSTRESDPMAVMVCMGACSAAVAMELTTERRGASADVLLHNETRI
jgi:hypothetical protein